MQENVAISMKNSIKKGKFRALPGNPDASPISRCTNLAGRFCKYPAESSRQVDSVGSAKRSWKLFLAEVYLQGEVLETNLAHTDFGLGSLKPHCKQIKRLVRKDVFNSVHVPVSAGERGQIKNSIGNRWEVWLRRDPLPLLTSKL